MLAFLDASHRFTIGGLFNFFSLPFGLRDYLCGTMNQIRFEGRNAQFFSTLRSRIDGYFTENNIKQSGNWKLYSKTLILLSTLVLSYVLLVFFTTTAWVSVLLCIFMGVNFATIGFNVMHDGSHGSYSRKAWVNKVMALSLNVLGGNSFSGIRSTMWLTTHSPILKARMRILT